MAKAAASQLHSVQRTRMGGGVCWGHLLAPAERLGSARPYAPSAAARARAGAGAADVALQPVAYAALMQATAYTYDPVTRSGSVLLDDGTPVPFDTAAFDAGGLRLLRPGQRVRIEVTAQDTDGPGNTAKSAVPADGDAGTDARPSPKPTAERGLQITLVTLQTL